MKYTTTNKIILSAVLFLSLSCSTLTEKPEAVSETIEISKDQFEANSMLLGKIEDRIFENTVKVNGLVTSPPTEIAKVSATLGGYIKNIFFENGQFVKKNQLLLEIGGSEIVDLQKNFAVSSANFKKIESDFNRSKILFESKAISEKEFLIIEADYKSYLADYKGLMMKVQNLGLTAAKIEDGDFQSSYFLKSPIDGFIYNPNTSMGANVDIQFELLEIVNSDKLQIKLFVFPNDLFQIKSGQTVRILAENSLDSIYTKINTVGVIIEDDSKSIPCFTSVSDNIGGSLIANMYVKADIIISKNRIQTLPQSAIIKSDNKNYILILKKQEKNTFVFVKREVQIGREQNDFVEIVDQNIVEDVLIKGGYYLSLN